MHALHCFVVYCFANERRLLETFIAAVDMNDDMLDKADDRLLLSKTKVDLLRLCPRPSTDPPRAKTSCCRSTSVTSVKPGRMCMTSDHDCSSVILMASGQAGLM